MAKGTSISLGDYFEKFINQQVNSAKLSSASEVIKAAVRLFEFEEGKKAQLTTELKKGERSGFVSGFNREDFLNELHQRHSIEK
jgi:antitoxin ParD1/3/4